MKDKIVVITGASDGIGAAAARLFTDKGARVIVIGRSAQKTKAVAKELDASYYLADFAQLVQVRKLAAQLKKDLPRIDVFVNNAGGIMGERVMTVDGHEKTFQVNHLAPFLLTTLLIPTLLKSKATIINTSSAANRVFGHFDITDLELEKSYSPNKAYGNAKLANILFTKELNRRYGDQGLCAAAFHPGVVATNFASDSTSVMRFIYTSLLNRFLLSPTKGADTLVWLATTQPGKDWALGEYYENRKISKASPQAYDEDLAKDLWTRSITMLGV